MRELVVMWGLWVGAVSPAAAQTEKPFDSDELWAEALERPDVTRVTTLPVGHRVRDPQSALLALATERAGDDIRAAQLLVQRAERRRLAGLRLLDRDFGSRAAARVAAIEREAAADLRRAASALSRDLARAGRPLDRRRAWGFVLLYRIHESLGDGVSAQREALRLTEACATCPAAADALVFLGDTAFAERDVLAARDYYEAAATHPRADSALRAYAHYRLGWCHRNLAEPDAAFAELLAARRLVAARGSTRVLHRHATLDAVAALARLERAPEQVVAALHDLAARDPGDAADLYDRYRRTLGDQGRRSELDALTRVWRLPD